MAKCLCCGEDACELFTSSLRLRLAPDVVERVGGCADCMNAVGSNLYWTGTWGPGLMDVAFDCKAHRETTRLVAEVVQ